MANGHVLHVYYFSRGFLYKSSTRFTHICINVYLNKNWWSYYNTKKNEWIQYAHNHCGWIAIWIEIVEIDQLFITLIETNSVIYGNEW